MKKIQSVLGDHQDAVVARGVDRELGIGAHLAGENAFTFGLLYEREDQRAARLRAQAQHTWKQAPQPRFGRWSCFTTRASSGGASSVVKLELGVSASPAL